MTNMCLVGEFALFFTFPEIVIALLIMLERPGTWIRIITRSHAIDTRIGVNKGGIGDELFAFNNSCVSPSLNKMLKYLLKCHLTEALPDSGQ